MQNSRNIGLDHGAGKGDADRSNRAKFVARFPVTLTGEVGGFERRGRRLVKTYGPRDQTPRTRQISQTRISQADYAKVSPDFAIAQGLADEANASFRARGINTCGH